MSRASSPHPIGLGIVSTASTLAFTKTSRHQANLRNDNAGAPGLHTLSRPDVAAGGVSWIFNSLVVLLS
jgi:hypothetical protein